jgi:hypothetical protein
MTIFVRTSSSDGGEGPSRILQPIQFLSFFLRRGGSSLTEEKAIVAIIALATPEGSKQQKRQYDEVVNLPPTGSRDFVAAACRAIAGSCFE